MSGLLNALCKPSRYILNSRLGGPPNSGLTELMHSVRFPWHVAFTAAPCFLLFVLSEQLLYLVKNMYVCVCVCVCVHTYMYVYVFIFIYTYIYIFILYIYIYWNSVVGDESYRSIFGSHGLGKRNHRGQILIEYTIKIPTHRTQVY